MHVCAATSCFLKVNCTPWLFAMDLYGTVDFASSKTVVKQKQVEIHLLKVCVTELFFGPAHIVCVSCSTPTGCGAS